ncbi:uroporphyrinogen decarboxylase family protein [Deferrisoma palaeochoriense]
MLTPNWKELTADEKYRERMRVWQEGEGLAFPSAEAREAYRERASRIRAAVELGKPERVPVCPFVGLYPARHGGATMREAMYEYEKLGQAQRRFYEDFDVDAYLSAASYTPGRVLEILDYRLYEWPGHGVGEDQCYQTVEGEYLKAEEYDLLLQDPTRFWVTRYMPRIFGALKAWETLPDLTSLLEIPNVGPVLSAFGAPEVQEAFQRLLEAGRAAAEWRQAVTAIDRGIVAERGLPTFRGGFSKAPFDIVADTLRGTKPMMFDLFRRPDKVLEAVERFVPKAIELGVRTATLARNPMVFMPLHKGEDPMMSPRDFERFYWPSLKAVILGLVEEGCVPMLFAEGAYTRRLDTLAREDLPEGRTLWVFENTVMRKAKEVLGGRACISGNVSGALLTTSTPAEVEAYVRDLLDAVATDGGFILGTGISLWDARPENLHAMIRAAREWRG